MYKTLNDFNGTKEFIDRIIYSIIYQFGDLFNDCMCSTLLKSETSCMVEATNKTISVDNAGSSAQKMLLNVIKLCGKTMSDRIVNGEVTSPQEFPFIAVLKYKNDPKKKNFREEFHAVYR